MDLAFQKGFAGVLPVAQAHAQDLYPGLTQSLAFKVGVKGNLTKAKWCRQLVRARRERNRFFSAGLFGEPAWDMLLELYAADLSQRRVTVSNLAEASGTPMTTALRWIDALVKEGFAARRPDPLDKRRVFVALTQAGTGSMERYLDSLPATVNPLND